MRVPTTSSERWLGAQRAIRPLQPEATTSHYRPCMRGRSQTSRPYKRSSAPERDHPRTPTTNEANVACRGDCVQEVVRVSPLHSADALVGSQQLSPLVKST